MVFREARSLAKEDDLSDRGEHLPSHVKATSDAVWESKLCLFDEAFHLSFTSERKNKLLNGNDNLQTQSRWDEVQEAFMTVYVGLLCSYRQCLVFPSKDKDGSSNDVGSTGSYGGAGFRSREFIRVQKYDRRKFLGELINTQMFDEFVTKRLYGSGASDVAFFDRAIDTYLKVSRFSMDRSYHAESLTSSFQTNANTKSNFNSVMDKENNASGKSRPSSAPASPNRYSASSSTMRKLFDRVRPSTDPYTIKKEGPQPLIFSARVHKKLKTIVPPEPSSEDLFDSNGNVYGNSNGNNNENNNDNGKDNGYGHYDSKIENDSVSVSLTSMESKGTHDTALSSPLASFENGDVDENDKDDEECKKIFTYNVFPSKLDKKLFGKPRPLPAAVLTEFERQKENAAQFRKIGRRVKNFVSGSGSFSCNDYDCIDCAFFVDALNRAFCQCELPFEF